MAGTGGRINEREIALQILTRAEKDHRKVDHCLTDALNGLSNATTVEKAMIKRLVDGTTERRITLDYVLDLYSKVKTAKMKPLIRRLLRLSVYQILFMDRVPDAAAVNEAVVMAGRHGLSTLKGYVNGVLRTIVREKDKIEYPNNSIRYSVPSWITDYWELLYGAAETERMLRILTTPSPLSVRIDERLGEAERNALVARWRAVPGVQIKQNAVLPYAYTLSGVGDPSLLPGFAEGSIYIQDASSMMVAEMAKPLSGETVVDVCASPGGKILHIYAKCGGRGTLIARDVTERKLSLLRDNAARLRADNLVIERHDAREESPEMEEKADLVICDLPCSGLGVLGRKPDLRYRVEPGDIPALVTLQRQILRASARMVRPGGRLVYSTCTIRAEENTEQAGWISLNLPFTCTTQRQILPGEVGADGFFIAVFKKK